LHSNVAAAPPGFSVVAVIGQVQLWPDEDDPLVQQQHPAVVQHSCNMQRRTDHFTSYSWEHHKANLQAGWAEQAAL